MLCVARFQTHTHMHTHTLTYTEVIHEIVDGIEVFPLTHFHFPSLSPVIPRVRQAWGDKGSLLLRCLCSLSPNCDIDLISYEDAVKIVSLSLSQSIN